MIRARQASFAVGTKVLVDGATVEVRPGEVLVLVGPNGAGKSTLLQLLAGERKPTAGTVELDGRALHRWAPAALARRRAVLPQNSQAPAGLTVEEVLVLGRNPHAGVSGPEEDRRVVGAVLEQEGLTACRHRRMETLSGGEAQRVQFARALVQLAGNPPGDGFAFLDEPTAALDLNWQLGLLERLRDRAAAGWGVAVVLHDLNLAAQFADRIALVHRGGVEACGVPEEVLQPDRLGRVFGVRSLVVPHPVGGRPLVLVLGRAGDQRTPP